jgi:hypothetical protein
LVPAGDDVVEGAVKLYPGLPWHSGSLAEALGLVKMEIFKSDPMRSLCGPTRAGRSNLRGRH